ncbi:Bro-N domain-containing protein [Candidatus Woesearchaeota archaeon]|nr:Bro-N domain-containing protein [Candidatus Woesearchaeota archaeon]MCF7900671.1 Bro-N domain-containing protein [Candidatus Woesearchaeota archaeon]MCF8013494.1 Bro-N domain-containing protein [Candidatus Woesearchaeota archaeon]
MEKNNTLAIFEHKKIRRTWFNEEWWFVAIDIVGALTDSNNPSGYLKDMRRRDESFKEGWVQIATPLEIETEGGRQKINCVSTKGAFRLIQSIPSKKTEPFKQWLAEVGYDRVKEIENPELAQKRMKETYKAKGYSDDWIEKRARGIAIRDELTDEWKQRGLKRQKDYSILTAEISKATFDMTPKEYKEFKRIKQENLRDHMDDLELIFSMLGERVSTEITRTEDSQGFNELEDSAKRGGKVAGNARKETEKEIKRKVSTKNNFLKQPESKKRLKNK